MDLFNIGFKVDSQPVAAGSAALRNFAGSAGHAEKSARALQAAFKGIKSSIPLAELQALARIQTGATNAARAQQRAEAESIRLGRLHVAAIKENLARERAQQVAIERTAREATRAAAAQQRAHDQAAKAAAASAKAQQAAANATAATQVRATERAQRAAERAARAQERADLAMGRAHVAALRENERRNRPPNPPDGGGRGIGEIGILRLRNILLGAAIYQTIQFGRALLRTSDQVKGMESRLRLVTKSQDEYNRVTEALTGISRRNLIGLTEAAALYVKIMGGLKGVAGATTLALEVTGSFSAALRVGGANAREASAAAIQFAQAIGSGVLRGDEFRSLAEASPVLLQNMADGLGVTRGALKSMADEGLLTANMAIGALLKTAVRAEIQSIGFGNTISGAGVQIQNAFIRMVAGVERTTGAFSGIASVGRGVAAVLDMVVPAIEAVKAAVVALTPALAGLTAGMVTFFTVSRGGTVLAAIATGFVAIRTAIAGASVALAGGGLIALLTNPALLAAVAALAGITALVAMRSGQSSPLDPQPASQDAADYIRDLDKRIAATKELDKVQTQAQLDAIDREHQRRQQVEALRKAAAALGANDEQAHEIRQRLKVLDEALTKEGNKRLEIGKREAAQAKAREEAAKRLLELEKLRAGIIADIDISHRTLGLMEGGVSQGEAEARASMENRGIPVGEARLFAVSRGEAQAQIQAIADARAEAEKFMEMDTSKLGEGFDRVSNAMFNFIDGFEHLVELQGQYNNAIEQGKDVEQARLKLGAAQIDTYASMAGAAKGFFNEGSKGYKAMAGAEKAFRAIQFALSVKAMVQDSAETISSVANSATRAVASGAAGVAKAFEEMGVWGFVGAAAIIAFLASVGVRLGGGGGGGAPTGQAFSTGRGTVLGDADAESESITNAIEDLQNIQDANLEINRSMLVQLRSIDAAIRGVGTTLVQRFAATGTATPFGNIDMFNMRGSSNETPAAINERIMAELGRSGGPLGEFVSERSMNLDLGGLLVTEIMENVGDFAQSQGTGLAFDAGQKIGDILGGALIDGMFYQTVRTGTNDIFGGDHDVEIRDYFRALDDEMTMQLTLVVRGLGSTVLTAVEMLGGDVAQATVALNSMVLGFDRVSLAGLSAEEVQKRLSAVFSALGDEMVRTVLPAMKDFQQIGEGLFQTLVRVASQTKAVNQALEDMGSGLGGLTFLERAAAVQDLIDKAGGLDELGGNLSGFITSFYTDSEQQAMRMARLQRTFDEMNLGALPASREGFKRLVQGLDLSTEAGRRQFSVLLGLAQSADEFYTAAEDAAGGTNKLVESLRALRDEAARSAAATRPAAEQLAGVRAQFQRQATLAALGNTGAAELLPDLGKQFMRASEAFSSTQMEYMRDLAFIQNAAERAAQVQERGMGFTSGSTLMVGTGSTTPSLAGPQTAVDTSSVVAEIRSLREEMNANMFTVAKNTGKIFDLHNRWDDGDRMRVHVEQDTNERIEVSVA